MKRLSASLLFLVMLASLSLAAQSNGMPPGHQMLADPGKFADGHVAALDHKLQLTADQKAKLRSVFLDEAQKLFAIMNNNTMPTEQKQAAIEKLHNDTAARVDSLLTPEQKKQGGPSRQNPHPTSQT